MPASQARQIAFRVLRRVETEDAYAKDLLQDELSQELRPEDAALATEITLGTLRWQRLLDFMLERHSRRPLASLDSEIRIALRMGLYQFRFLSRVPTWAAVNESVELVKQARKKSAATLVNAVLRQATSAKSRRAELRFPAGTPAVEALAITYSHPTWLVERWLEAFGKSNTVALLEYNNRAPSLACALLEFEKREEAMQSLEAAGVNAEPGRILRAAITVRHGNPAKAEAFHKGWLTIQDEASQVIPLLLAARRGDTILDLCAAPGGKRWP